MSDVNRRTLLQALLMLPAVAAVPVPRNTTTIVLEMDGRKVAEAILPYLPKPIKRRGRGLTTDGMCEMGSRELFDLLEHARSPRRALLTVQIGGST